MTRQVRKALFVISLVALAFVFFRAYSLLAPLGESQSKYGDMVNHLTVAERHITDAVTSVNFDVRGFDTLGEEFILFTSVMGVILLMRRRQDEPAGNHEDKSIGRTIFRTSDAIRVTTLLLIGPTVLFGIYVVVHGQVTPGGGFQGGVILSTAPLLLYLCAEYNDFRRTVPQRVMEIMEACGAACYILVGLICAVLGGAFLENLLPLGKTGNLTSGGMVPLINLGVGLEVGGGMVLALLAYLEELVEEKEQ